MEIEFVGSPTRQIEYKKVCKLPLPHAPKKTFTVSITVIFLSSSWGHVGKYLYKFRRGLPNQETKILIGLILIGVCYEFEGTLMLKGKFTTTHCMKKAVLFLR
jgi:hypothetical protein